MLNETGIITCISNAVIKYRKRPSDIFPNENLYFENRKSLTDKSF